jgi:hypothetical protein
MTMKLMTTKFHPRGHRRSPWVVTEDSDMAESGWGPFAADLDAAERIARLSSLRAIAMGVCRWEHKLIDALRLAGTDDDALSKGSYQFAALPALAKCRLWACYADLGDRG